MKSPRPLLASPFIPVLLPFRVTFRAMQRRSSVGMLPPLPFFAWKAAHAAGRARAWLRTGWHEPFVGVVSIMALAVPAILLSDLFAPFVKEHRILLGIAATAAVLLLAVHRVRHTVYVPDFTVHRDQDRGQDRDQEVDEKAGAALAARLRHELAAITSVHRTVDEALPTSDGRVSQLEIAVEDIGEQLEATIGEQLSMSKWGRLPGSVARATGLFRGPRLIGSLHQQGRSLVLTAELSGGGMRGSWRVTDADLRAEDDGHCKIATPGAEDEQDLGLGYRLVRQMAYRIAASIASMGSPRWEALLSFTEGLRAYRRVRLTEADREIELRTAERCFRRALQTDNTFSQGHYNLGVVYAKLGERDAALAAFRRAIESDPSAFSAYLALAMAYFDRAVDLFYRGARESAVAEDFLQARVFARRAITIAPTEPRPWNVYGAAVICEAWKGLKPSDPRAEWQDAAAEGVDAFLVASELAWRRLCRHEWAGSRAATDEARFVTLICMENLAEVYFETAAYAQSAAILREALRLEPCKPSLHLALGKALTCLGLAAVSGTKRARYLNDARDEFYEVHGDGLPLEQRVARWAWLLAVHTERMRIRGRGDSAGAQVAGRTDGERSDERGAQRAQICALDCAAPPERLVLAALKGNGPAGPACTRYRKQLDLVRLDLCRHLDRWEATAEWHRLLECLDLLEACESTDADVQGPRRQRLSTVAAPDPGPTARWKEAQRALRRARDILCGGRATPWAAVRNLHQAIEILRPHHFRQIRDQGLEALLARGYLLLQDAMNDDASLCDGPVTEATEAGDPRFPRSKSDCLRLALDYAFRAVAADPESPARRLVLAEVHDALGDHRQAEDERRAALSLGSSLELLGDRETLGGLSATWLQRIHDSQDRQAIAKRAVEQFEHLRDLLESSPEPPPDPNHGEPRSLRFEEHAAIHHHLGKILIEADEREAAAANLRIAALSGYRELREAGHPGSKGPGRPTAAPRRGAREVTTPSHASD